MDGRSTRKRPVRGAFARGLVALLALTAAHCSGSDGVADAVSDGGSAGEIGDASSGKDGASSGIGGASSGIGGASSGIGGASSGKDGASSGIGGASSGIGGASSGIGGASSAGAGGFDVTGAASLAELSAIFSARCVGCHDGTRAGLVDLRPDSELYARLTTPLATPSCNGRILVVPGSIGESLLPAKVQPRPPCGARMPSECSVQGCLSAAEIQTIVNYVGSGAPEQ